MENREWRRVYGSIIAAVIFACLGYYALNYLDCFSGGCALTFISFFLLLSSLGTTAFFFHRARTVDGILSGEGLLVHWVYSGEELRKSAEREYRTYREANKALFLVVGGMLSIAIVLMVLLGGEPGVFTAGILFIVLVLVFIVSRVAPVIERRRALGAPKDAYIAKNGIIYEGMVYPFRSFLMRMNDVCYREKKNKNPSVLLFSFLQLVGTIPRPFEISVPVPAGKEEEAREVLRQLGGTGMSLEESGERVTPTREVPIPAGIRSREECGEEMVSTAKESPATCPGCGVDVDGPAQYCGNCGKEIN